LFSLDQTTLDAPAIEVAGHEPDPAQHAAEDEERAQLRRAMESLTAPHRIVFELAVYQERPYAEIGQLLGIPVGTVKSRMHNAVAALKQLLGAADGSTDGASDLDAQSDARKAGGDR
jgi:RNA polymerase sigma-70 factor (ECF subfamily)